MSRTKNTIINARVNTIFYIALFVLSLYSRKIFLLFLGDDLIGLNTTIQNILGLLNLAELGIWPATAYALYQHIYNNDREKIKQIVSLFGHFYKIVGYFILFGGLTITLFLPYIFKNSGIDILFAYASFCTFIINVLLGYFFNYKQILLVADQKNFVLTTISSTIQILKVLIQILLLYLTNGNFYIWLLIEFVFSILNTIYLNIYVKKYYPWLKIGTFDKNLLVEHSQLLKNIKRMISHKFAAVSISQTDNILIYSFAGLAQVTSFTNYTLLINKLVSFFNSFLNSGAASIGHLVASNDLDKIKNVFYEFFALRYWIAGIIIISLFYLINPFIGIWLGTKYILNDNIVILLLINTYITITRNTVDSFIDGYGLYGNVWAPWTEALLNLIISIVLGFKFGILGILFGTTVSAFLIVCIWKPYYLFKSGFKRLSLKKYWLEVLKNLAILLCVLWTISIVRIYDDYEMVNYKVWIIQSIWIFTYSLVIYGTISYLFSQGMRSLIFRMSTLLKNKLKK